MGSLHLFIAVCHVHISHIMRLNVVLAPEANTPPTFMSQYLQSGLLIWILDVLEAWS